jgi:hypothetical protein
MKGKRPGIYVRASTGHQNTGLQKTELTESVESRGWKFKVYRNQGFSGTKVRILARFAFKPRTNEFPIHTPHLDPTLAQSPVLDGPNPALAFSHAPTRSLLSRCLFHWYAQMDAVE